MIFLKEVYVLIAKIQFWQPKFEISEIIELEQIYIFYYKFLFGLLKFIFDKQSLKHQKGYKVI